LVNILYINEKNFEHVDLFAITQDRVRDRVLT